MRRDRRTDAAYQREVGAFVEREVIYGVSGLVHEIGKLKSDEWFHLFMQDHWETPAREAIRELPREKLTYPETECSWQDFCAANDLDPHCIQIYEHWIVSDWLAGQLEKRGEVIERNFYGLTIWGPGLHRADPAG